MLRRMLSAVSSKAEESIALLGVFDEIKQVGVAATEFLGAVHPEGVIPDHPVPAGQPQVPLGDDL